MRTVSLPGFSEKVTATPAALVGTTLLKQSPQNRWPYPQPSLILLATMVWPNNEARRSLYLDAWTAVYGKVQRVVPGVLEANGRLELAGRRIDLRPLGNCVLDKLDAEIKSAIRAWRNVADLVFYLARLDANPHTAIVGGASINKAKKLINASQHGANRQRLEIDWAAFKDVAHLAAATSFLALLGVMQTGKKDEIGIETPIFADPGSVLCLGMKFQRFGTTFVPKSRSQPLLDLATLWSIPADGLFVEAEFHPGTFTPDELAVLSSADADP